MLIKIKVIVLEDSDIWKPFLVPLKRFQLYNGVSLTEIGQKFSLRVQMDPGTKMAFVIIKLTPAAVTEKE